MQFSESKAIDEIILVRNYCAIKFGQHFEYKPWRGRPLLLAKFAIENKNRFVPARWLNGTYSSKQEFIGVKVPPPLAPDDVCGATLAFEIIDWAPQIASNGRYGIISRTDDQSVAQVITLNPVRYIPPVRKGT